MAGWPLAAQLQTVDNELMSTARVKINANFSYLDGGKMHYAGTWSSSTTYAAQEVVQYSSVTYISLAGSNLNHQPDVSALWWVAVGSSGGGGGAVSSVFGRTGDVVATSGDYDTLKVTENTNLYFTQARARAAFSGTSPVNYDTATGVISCSTCLVNTGTYSNPPWLTSVLGSIISGNIAGNAATSTALASSPALCSSGEAPRGILANGDASGCQALATGSISGLTANAFPKATSATTIADSHLVEDASTNQITASGSLNGAAKTITFGSTAAVDLKDGNRFEITLTGNWTPSAVSNAKPGQKFSVAMKQDGTGGRTVDWGSFASGTCTISTTANITTTQFFEVKVDGSIVGAECPTDEAGILASGATATACAAGTVASSALCAWFDATANTVLVRDHSDNIYAAVKTAASRTANQFQTYVNTSGVPQTAAIVSADVPTAVLDGSVAYAADAGANDTYTATLSPAPGSYITGARYRFKANTANTGAATINFNSLGAKTIKKAAGGVTTDLSDNDIRAGQFVDVVYDGTNMQMQSTLGNAASGGTGTPADVQVFSTAGDATWTKPAGTPKWVRVILVGAGGSGGGGISGSGVASNRTGGSGGGGGSRVEYTFEPGDLPSSLHVTVGTGASGGAGGGSPADGTNGTDSCLSTSASCGGTLYARAFAGGGGAKGGSTTKSGGSGAGTLGDGVLGTTTNLTGGVPAATSNADGIAGQGAGTSLGGNGHAAEYGGGGGGGGVNTGVKTGGGSAWGGGGGGGGGSVDNANVGSGGGAAGLACSYAIGSGPAGGAAGTNNGTAGSSATPINASCMGSGGGGGGGGASIAAGNGGDGAQPGGGGGGGGGASNSQTAGNGGKGGDGKVWVITIF